MTPQDLDRIIAIVERFRYGSDGEAYPVPQIIAAIRDETAQAVAAGTGTDPDEGISTTANAVQNTAERHAPTKASEQQSAAPAVPLPAASALAVVPGEPTPEMQSDAFMAWLDMPPEKDSSDEEYGAVYKAMLAASPYRDSHVACERKLLEEVADYLEFCNNKNAPAVRTLLTKGT